MTREEAHRLLDAARAGLLVAGWQITAALMATGDLDSPVTTAIRLASHQVYFDIPETVQ